MQVIDHSEVIHSLHTAHSAREVLDRLMGGLAHLGIAGVVHCPAPSGQPLIRGQAAMLEWARHYEQAGYLAHDPVVHGMLRAGTPMSWCANRPAQDFSPLQRRIFFEAGEHGLKSGISVPVHIAAQMHVLGLFSEVPLPADHLLLAQINYLAFHAHERLRSLHQRTQRYIPCAALSPRERDCLNWTKEGLTAAEIADKLNLSERTVIHHLQSAKARLGARNLPHAVARAIVAGELLP